MHRAPAVTFPVARSRWHLRTLVAVWLLGCAAALGLLQTQATPAASALVFACLLLAGSIAFRGWQQSPVGHLQWDGQRWHWSGVREVPQECRIHLLLDFQTTMLVRIHAESGSRTYLWLEAVAPDSKWIALRRAVVSSLRSYAARGAAQRLHASEEERV